MATFTALHNALTLLGYVEGAPSGFRNASRLEAAAAAGACCEQCGHVGLSARHYHRPHERAYVALVVCAACQWAEQL
jgi:hypothetical protein